MSLHCSTRQRESSTSVCRYAGCRMELGTHRPCLISPSPSPCAFASPPPPPPPLLPSPSPPPLPSASPSSSTSPLLLLLSPSPSPSPLAPPELARFLLDPAADVQTGGLASNQTAHLSLREPVEQIATGKYEDNNNNNNNKMKKEKDTLLG